MFSVCESDPQVQITGVNYINAGKLSVDPLSPDDILWTIVRYPDPVNSYKGQGEIQPGTETTNTPIYIPAGNDFDNSVFLQLTVNGQGDCPTSSTLKSLKFVLSTRLSLTLEAQGQYVREDFQVSGAQISGISINNVVWRAVRRVTGGPDVPADGSFDYPNSLLPIYTPGLKILLMAKSIDFNLPEQVMSVEMTTIMFLFKLTQLLMFMQDQTSSFVRLTMAGSLISMVGQVVLIKFLG